MIARGEFEPSRCAAEHRNSPNGWAIYDRFALFCFGGVLPLLVFVSISIWMEPSDAISATDLTSRVKRMTVFPNTAPFIPLIGYAILSLGLVCVNFDSYANRVVVRAGVFTGIVLSLQFQAMFSIGGRNRNRLASAGDSRGQNGNQEKQQPKNYQTHRQI